MDYGFEKLTFSSLPQICPKKGFVTLEGSSIITYYIDSLESFTIVGSHSDSPSLFIPTDPDFDSTFHQIDVLHYSGGLTYSWFGRDLKLVGSIFVRKKDFIIEQIVISDTKPIAFIPAPPSSYNSTTAMDRKTAFRPIFGEI
jgi:aspartyl aminopeptidase